LAQSPSSHNLDNWLTIRSYRQAGVWLELQGILGIQKHNRKNSMDESDYLLKSLLILDFSLIFQLKNASSRVR
jgi:hypothetical protein